MKKLTLLLLLSLGLIGNSYTNESQEGIKSSDLRTYKRYEMNKSIDGAFGLKLGVIYTNAWLKPTPVEPRPFELEGLSQLAALLADDAIDYYDTGNKVEGKNSPRYLKSFRLLLDQNKKTFQITGFSNEAKGSRTCEANQRDFMLALDKKYGLLIDKESIVEYSFMDPPLSLTVTSPQSPEREIVISCEATKPLCDPTQFVLSPNINCNPTKKHFLPFDSEWTLIIKYLDRGILSHYRYYIDEKALEEKNKAIKSYDI